MDHTQVKRLMQQRNTSFFTNPSLFQHLHNKVIRKIKVAKISYYPNKIHSLKLKNISRRYTKIRDLCGLNKSAASIPGVAHLPAPEAAEVINTHFTVICQTLPSLELTSLPTYPPTPAAVPQFRSMRLPTSYSSSNQDSPSLQLTSSSSSIKNFHLN